MAIDQYQTKNFFRKANNDLLKRYFSEKGLFDEIDFSQKGRRAIDAFFDIWLALDEKMRENMEINFQEIHNLANEVGNNVLISEAENNGENLIVLFQTNEIEDPHDRAFWVFLERKPEYWERAKTFTYVESLNKTYWKKRGCLGHPKAKIDLGTLDSLKMKISDFFVSQQGRGKGCQIDYYERTHDGVTKNYYFAYPEDYGRADLEWCNGEMEQRTVRAAFEVIFVYNQERGELDLYCPNIKLSKQKVIFQKMFCQVVLGMDLPKEVKEKIYDVQPLLSPDFEFDFDTQKTGIEEMYVTKMFVSINRGKKEKLTLQADTSSNRMAVYDLLKKIKEVFPDIIEINSVTIKAVFSDKKTREFSVSNRDSCNLNLTVRDNTLKQVLIDSNIQLTHN